MIESDRKIHFFETANELKSFIKKCSQNNQNKYSLVYFKDFDRECFDEGDVVFLDCRITDTERDIFLNEYKKVVRLLSSKSLFWNATDIASCNRFTSPLAAILEEIFIIEKSLRETRENLLILSAGEATKVFYKINFLLAGLP